MRSDLRMIICYCFALGWWEMKNDGGSEQQRAEAFVIICSWRMGRRCSSPEGFSVVVFVCGTPVWWILEKVGRVSGMWWVLNDVFGGFFSHGHGFNSPWATEALLGQEPVLTFCRKFVISLGVFLISQFIYKSISLSLWWHTHCSLTDHRMLIAHKK